MDFRVFRQTPISHLNCFHSLCKGPFVNLRQFSLVIYSHHLRPLAHSPPPPLVCAFVCLHGFYMFYWFFFFNIYIFKCYKTHYMFYWYRLAFFHLHVFFYMFHTGPLFLFTGFFLHVSYRPLFSFTWFLQGFKHSVSRFFCSIR